MKYRFKSKSNFACKSGGDYRSLEYIIVGDVPKHNFTHCLVMVCGKSHDRAEEILNRILNNPDENDKRLIKDHCNLRIDKVEDKDCWWNFNCD